MTPHLNGLIVQIRGHNICFHAELTKMTPNYIVSLNTSSYLELCRCLLYFCSICIQVVENFAIDLIAEDPIVVCTQRNVWSNGGGALGHPKVYINLVYSFVLTAK